jgi:hypothetical protein
MLLTWLIVGLVIFGIAVVPDILFPVITVAVGGTALRVGLGILLVLLVIAMTFYALFWLSFLPSVMIVEDRFYMGAIRRSRDLASGNWGRIFVVGFFTAIVTYGVMFVLLLLVGIVFGIQMVVSGGAGDPAGPGMRPLMIGTQIVSGIMQAIFTPVAALPFVLLYFDVRVRREGYDIELLAREMGNLPPEPPVMPR